jgi:intracellular multiplication protein IcmK
MTFWHNHKNTILISGLCCLLAGTSFLTNMTWAGSVTAKDALKAVAPTSDTTAPALQDPAEQSANALDAQENLQSDVAAATPSATKTDATATPPSATTNTTQMGPTMDAATPPSSQEVVLPKGVLPPTTNVAPPSLDGTVQDVSVPPLTPATPGMDLPVEPEKSPEELEAELREDAFKAASGTLMPMRPDEIRRIKEMADENKLAIETPILPNPKSESTFTPISLDPGQAPVELKTALGHVTTLSILDATGMPWPIQDISWAGNFEVQQPEQGSNMLRITPMSEFAFGNISMRLIGLTPPVIFTLKTDRRAVQVRADIQIPQNGPNATPAPIQSKPTITTAAGDIGMTNILEGVPPTEAVKMTISGVDGRTTAYDVSGITYVRTPYTLLSPAWNASVRSADGTNVYALKYTPVLLLSDKGQLLKARLQKLESDDE